MLHIKISSSRKVNSLTNEFNELFPHLQLKLYYKPADKSNHSKHAHLQKEHFATKLHDILADCQDKKLEGEFTFHSEMSIKTFKDQLEQLFHIHCEIYHLAGKHQWSTLPAPGENPLFEANFEVK